MRSSHRSLDFAPKLLSLKKSPKLASPQLFLKVKFLSTHKTVWVMFLQFCKKKIKSE